MMSTANFSTVPKRIRTCRVSFLTMNGTIYLILIDFFVAVERLGLFRHLMSLFDCAFG